MIAQVILFVNPKNEQILHKIEISVWQAQFCVSPTPTQRIFPRPPDRERSQIRRRFAEWKALR